MTVSLWLGEAFHAFLLRQTPSCWLLTFMTMHPVSCHPNNEVPWSTGPGLKVQFNLP